MHALHPSFILICCLCFTSVSRAQGLQDFALEGIYAGSMRLYDGGEREIPIDVSLVLTGETYFTPDGEERQIIDGAFVVDEEGGPYAFVKVSFDIEDSRIDMRYNRPQMNFDDIPSSFRLTGHFREDGSITGRVLSGVRGPIGEFVLQPTDLPVLPMRDKYQGVWEGVADLTGGGQMPFRVTLNDALVAFANPPNYEFEYTPGKIGHIRWNQTNIAITDVSIDYLRRQVVLHKRGASGGAELSVQFNLDFLSGHIEGQIQSVFRGQTATFSLEQR